MGLFSWFTRLFKIGEANINAQLDKLEDPVKMTEQSIRDLKKDLNQSLQSLAEVKALAIRSKKELEVMTKKASDYEGKAILLLQQIETGKLSSSEADHLAGQALAKKEQLDLRVQSSQKDVKNYDQMVIKMEDNVMRLKQQISTWEGELKTLRARSKVSETTAKLNKQIARIDSKDTLAMLDKMKEKVAQQEALAQSYEEISDANTSIDDEIDKALGTGSPSNIESSESLKKLKEKMAQKNEGTASENPTSDKSEPPPESMSELEKLKQQLRKDKDDT